MLRTAPASDPVFQIDSRHASVRMHVRPPSRALSGSLPALEGYDEKAERPYARTHFAIPRVAVLVELGEPLEVTGDREGDTWVRAPGGFAAGLSDGPAATRHAGCHCGVQVDLAPLAARRLFGVPLRELRGRAVPLADLLPRSFRSLCERLGEARDMPTRLDRLEDFLTRRLAAAPESCPRVAGALGRIEEARGRLDVGRLSQWLGISQKHLIALFHDQVGVSPKLYARLVRHEHAIAAARAHPERSWAEIALEGGYSDQSHLIREVRAFTGTTPKALRADLWAPAPARA